MKNKVNEKNAVKKLFFFQSKQLGCFYKISFYKFSTWSTWNENLSDIMECLSEVFFKFYWHLVTK